MPLTNRNIASIVIAVLSGFALWLLPDHVRGDNRLFGSNGTLLPALALAIILGLSALEVLQSLLAVRRSRIPHAKDVAIGRGALFGMLLVTLLAGVFAVLLRPVGYVPVALLLVSALMVGTGGRRPLVVLAVSAVAVAILVVGLRFGLGVHLPLWPSANLWGG